MAARQEPDVRDDGNSQLVLRPDAASWVLALGGPRGRNLGEASGEFRRELGLPTDRPIVMSGHQPAIWHPGILAKWIAMVRAGERFGAHAAWLVVDHDAVRPMDVRVPMRVQGRTVGEEGTLKVRDLSLAGNASDSAAAPACTLPAKVPVAERLGAGESFALPSVAEGLQRIGAALTAHAGASSRAEQVALATRDLVHSPSGGLLEASSPPSTVLATAMARTTRFRVLLERMRADPRGCVEAYNRAALSHPRARVRALSVGADVELPVWVVEGFSRRGLLANELGTWLDRMGSRVGGEETEATASGEQNSTGSGLPTGAPILAPKALFMTLLARLYACELFIHGLGGGGPREGEGYDEVMREWARAWLGNEAELLAPMATVTATLRLPLGSGEVVTMEEAREAVAKAWRARNSPSLVGDAGGQARKRDLAGQIAALPRHSRERRQVFHELRELVHRSQASHADDLTRLGAAADRLRERAKADEVRSDRTWAFAFYSSGALDALDRDVRTALEPATGVNA